METFNLFDGKIYVCSRDEARKLWNAEPHKRPHIWLEDEFTRCLLFDSETLQTIVENKKNNLGYVYK